MTSLSYRRDIDGLRGLSIALVLIYHAFPDYLPSGFIGVDIFFVISGYLISNILIQEIGEEKFSFFNFYQRRINRIFPALFLVLLTVFIFGWFYLTNKDYVILGKHIAGGGGFIANLILWRESGYFNPNSELKPLLHLWSLGIEEQFYILMPILLILAHKIKQGKLLVWIILAIGMSFLTGLYLTSTDLTAAFYSPLSRSWEILFGSVLAYLNQKSSLTFSHLINNILSTLGILLISLSLIFLDHSSIFPGAWPLLPVLGACLIIAAGPNSLINSRFLGNPFSVFIGLISYPLYLWHWPLLSFAKIILQPFAPTASTKIFLLILSVVLSYVTYRCVEIPLRKIKSRFGSGLELKSLILFGLVFSVSFIGLLNFFGVMHTSRLYTQAALFHIGREDDGFKLNSKYKILYREDCNFLYVNESTISPDCYLPKHKNSVFIWGDSYAQHLNSGFKNYFKDIHVSLLQVATSSCPASLPEQIKNVNKSHYCSRANNFAFKKIVEVRPNLVIIAQAKHYSVQHLKSISNELHKYGIKVLIIGPAPQWKVDLSEILLRQYILKNKAIPFKTDLGLDLDVLQIDEKLSAELGGQYISLTDVLCENGQCLTRLGEDLPEDMITIDYGHLTERASSFVVREAVAAKLEKIITLK